MEATSVNHEKNLLSIRTSDLALNGGIVDDLPTSLEDSKKALHDYFMQMFSKPIANQIHLNAIVKIPEVAAITSNIDMIRAVLLENKNVVIVDDMVKSNLKPEQNTIILRDMPSGSSESNIIAIFTSATSSDGSSCPTVQSVREDMNDTWFVTFASEVEARSALQAISGSEIGGIKVKARLKTESMAKYQTTNTNAGYNPYRGEPGQSPTAAAAAVVPGVFIAPTNFPPGVPPAATVYGNPMMYSQAMGYPQGYTIGMPPGNFPPFTPMMNAQAAPIGYPNGMQGYAIPQSQPMPNVRGNYQPYSNQYPGGKNMGGNRGGRNPRSNPSSPQGSGSGQGRFGNGGYRKNQGDGDTGFDAGNRGAYHAYAMPVVDPNMMQQQQYMYPGMYINGQFLNGYAMDPILQQQLQQQQQQLHMQQHVHTQHQQPRMSLRTAEQPSSDMHIGAGSDHENEHGREYIYFAGRTQKSLQSASADQIEGLSSQADRDVASSVLKSSSVDATASETTSPDDPSSTSNQPVNKEKNPSYAYRSRDRGGSNIPSSNGDPHMKPHYHDDNKFHRKSSGSIPNQQANSNSQQGNSASAANGHHNRNSGGRDRDRQGSSQQPPNPTPSQGAGNPQVDHNRRGQFNRPNGHKRNDNDSGNRGHTRSRDPRLQAPQFNLEADFPTLIVDDAPHEAPSSQSPTSAAMKGGYAAALKSSAVKAMTSPSPPHIMPPPDSLLSATQPSLSVTQSSIPANHKSISVLTHIPTPSSHTLSTADEAHSHINQPNHTIEASHTSTAWPQQQSKPQPLPHPKAHHIEAHQQPAAAEAGIIFGSFKAVIPEAQVKTLYGVESQPQALAHPTSTSLTTTSNTIHSNPDQPPNTAQSSSSSPIVAPAAPTSTTTDTSPSAVSLGDANIKRSFKDVLRASKA